MKIGVPSVVEEVVASDFVAREVAKTARSLQRHDRKSKRELANRNERKRMKVINDGFQSLRKLLPQADDEKLSKAAILQRTVDYISQLLQERQKILQHLDGVSNLKILKMSEVEKSEAERPVFNKSMNGSCVSSQSCYVDSYGSSVPSIPGSREMDVQSVCIDASPSIRFSLPLGMSTQIQPSSIFPVRFEAMETEQQLEETTSNSSSSNYQQTDVCNIGSLDVILRAIHSIEGDGVDSNDASSSSGSEESGLESESCYAVAAEH